MSAEQLPADERTRVRVGQLRLLGMLAGSYVADGRPMMSVRPDVVQILCDAAIALDIYEPEHEALNRLDRV